MRKRKKYVMEKPVFGIAGMIFLLTVIIVSVLTFIVPVNAGELVQSPDRVVIDLVHEHTTENCYESIWVPCGGMWANVYDENLGATVYYCTNNRSTEVRNGVVLSSIHYGWVTSKMTGYHAGEYASRINCTEKEIGTFTVEKATAGENSTLTASVEVSDDQIRDISISWRYPDQSISGDGTVSLTQNGVYCAILTWTDVKTGAVRQTYLNYTDISSPIALIFQSGGKVLFEKTVVYGDMLPEIDLPIRTGYDFMGFYAGDVMWYDSDGHKNDSIRMIGSSLKQIVNASYQARSYNVYYGEDTDLDGLKDHVFRATYDEAYGPITVTDTEREGWIFEGYYLNGEKVFDAEGRSTGVWRWDSTEDIVLEAVYRRPSPSSSGNNNANQGHHSDDSANNGSGDVPNTSNTDTVSDNSSVSQNPMDQDSYGDGNESGNHGYGSNGHGGRNTGSDQSAFSDDSAEEGTEGQRLPGHYSGILTEDSYPLNENDNYDTGEIDVSGEINLLSENMASNDPIELQKIKNRTIFLKAVEVTGITVGVLGLGYLIGWLIITKLGLAKIYSIQADGAKRQIGDTLILRGENAFHIRIKDRIAQKGDTGRYQVAFSKSFVLRHINEDVIIHCLGKNIAEVVRPDINMFIE